MKKKFTLPALAVVLLVFALFAGCHKNQNALSTRPPETQLHIVPESVARAAAVHFNPQTFFLAADGSDHSPSPSSLTGNNSIKESFTINDSHGKPAIYIYNFADQAGFLFVSADSNMNKILAFVPHGGYQKDIVPVGLLLWANKTIANIELVRKGAVSNEIATRTWSDDGTHTGHLKPVTGGTTITGTPTTTITNVTVGPLLPVTWGQDCGFNDLCPNGNCTDCSTLTLTGCVATAMAQVAHYWHIGTNYNFAGMPATTGNVDVQRLMRDAGISVSMGYSCASNGGSSADGTKVPNALKNNFGFGSATHASSFDWLRTQNNLKNHWPVFVEGCNQQTNLFLGVWYTYQNCHEWVCDGYSETTYTCGPVIEPVSTEPAATASTTPCFSGSILYFHMNWGWHEANTNPPVSVPDYNGWFGFNDWTIYGAGSGGSNLNFQYGTAMTAEVHP